MADCQACYTCEKGIVPTVNVNQFKDASKDGKPIPKEWLRTAEGECQACFTCQSCYTAQAPCINCYTAQKT